MTATKDLTPQEREEYWRMVNEDFVSSGMTRKEYCSKNDIPMSTLRYWQQRIKEKDDISQTENNRFVELVPPASKNDMVVKAPDYNPYVTELVISYAGVDFKLNKHTSLPLVANVLKELGYAK